MPESISCRVIYITGYFASTILLTAYSAVLISNLTTQAPRRPFDSLQSFLDVGSHELIAIQKSTDYGYFSVKYRNIINCNKYSPKLRIIYFTTCCRMQMIHYDKKFTKN